MKKIILLVKQALEIIKIIYRTLILRCKYYSIHSTRAMNNKKIVVLMVDGRCSHGGLADRLKGITTVYYLSKQLGYDFRINHTTPFDLEKIYSPNLYDWRIDPSEISYNSKDVYVCNLMGVNNKVIPFESIKKMFVDVINHSARQIHIYTNIPYALYQTDSYSKLYNELFNISDSFERYLAPYVEQLGQEYICVGARFAGSLGGFKDAYKELDEMKKSRLIESAISKIDAIHNQHIYSKIYLATDSDVFAEEASRLDYIITLQDDRTHTDMVVAQPDNFDSLKGTYIDFIISSRSTKIYQIKGDGMYAGAFTYSASQLNNTPYQRLTF